MPKHEIVAVSHKLQGFCSTRSGTLASEQTAKPLMD
uniref:Uncharacterized protein n=1 Tax=Arundo donax TaxID=35708 RepID=A0A0A9ELS7_ARUDO